ncbi:uncharacterized protein LOC113206949 [Frankliniella occidentalis]|uniref:Uncharacterized protein LOC113206949 n=1 Tax=Frankliniella occidentalis TaxID=133901 RepID=A0A6J1SEB2_FRAOC|nr:uncharacterized protein LOC113206949 [Frankliniella occidentalis]
MSLSRYVIVLSEMSPRYIRWPNAFEREEIKTAYEEQYGFPGAVGAIDGVHMATAPRIQPQNYVNRHHTYSILVPLCCTNLLYRDVCCGESGAVGDVRNFKRSPLSRNLTRPELLSEGEHLIGDEAYTCTDMLYIDFCSNKQKYDNMTVQYSIASLYLTASQKLK